MTIATQDYSLMTRTQKAGKEQIQQIRSLKDFKNLFYIFKKILHYYEFVYREELYEDLKAEDVENLLITHRWLAPG